jgi:hypothetical protein
MPDSKDAHTGQLVAVQPPGSQSEVLAVLSIIERASKDPNSDADKLEKLFELRERVREQVARDAFVEAMVRVQDQLPVIKQAGRITYAKGGSIRYAKWEDIIAAIQPVLTANGFTLTFEFGGDDKKIEVTAVLDHVLGHSRRNTVVLPKDDSGGKTGVQGVGSSYSYGKRYSTSGVLNLTWGGEDDDGNNGRHQPILLAQAEELQVMIADVGSTPEKLLLALGEDSLDSIPASKFERAKQLLEQKRKKSA